MDNNKFQKFVEKNTQLQRRGVSRTPTSVKKFDEDNSRLASVVTHPCKYCDQEVTNQVIYIQRQYTQYGGRPFWREKCYNCKAILNKKY
jgi:hypothetical protein